MSRSSIESRLCLWFVLLGACAAAQQAQAQTPNPHQSEPQQLTDIVVTGTRTEKQRLEAPIRTEVVGLAEIQATGALTLKEALSNVPGLQIQDLAGTDGGGKSGYQLTMQGLKSDQVLVLIDGLPVAASTSSTVDLGQYLLSDVERIEVVKGPASAQYGSAAMGGVINVITRAPSEGLQGTVGFGVGTRGKQNDSGKRRDVALYEYLAELQGGTESLRGRVALERFHDDGFSPNPSGWDRQGDRIRRQQATGRLAWKPQAGTDLSAEFSRYDEKDGQRYSTFRPPRQVPLSKTEDIDRNRLVLTGRHRFDQGSVVDARALHERYATVSRTGSNGESLIERESTQHNRHLSVQWDLPPLDTQSWQLGADLHHEALEQFQNGQSELQTAGSVKRTSRELFVQGDVFVTPALEFIVGTRVQHDSDFGSHWAPKLAVRGQVLKHGDRTLTLRASVGQGYRVPNLKERHYLFDHSALGYMVMGNPDLQPESSTGLQLGAVLAQGMRWSLDMNAYYNRVRDLIQVDRNNSTMNAANVAVYRYGNIDRARTHGIETVAEYQPTADWRLTTALTLGHSKDLGTGHELTQRPRRVLRLGADWQATPKAAISMRLRHQSRELSDTGDGLWSDAWTTVDLNFRYRIHRDLSAYLRIDNLFDEQRDFSQSHQLGPKSGRMVMVGLRYGFDLSGKSGPLGKTP